MGDSKILNSTTEHFSTFSQTNHKVQVWIVGLPLIILVVLCCDVAILILPALRRYPRAYSHVMRFLVALAVSALLATALLFLIPEAFGLRDKANALKSGYMWRACAMAGGLYASFLLEGLVSYLIRLKQLLFERSTERSRLDVMHPPNGIDMALKTLSAESSSLAANSADSAPLCSVKSNGAARTAESLKRSSTGFCALAFAACFVPDARDEKCSSNHLSETAALDSQSQLRAHSKPPAAAGDADTGAEKRDASADEKADAAADGASKQCGCGCRGRRRRRARDQSSPSPSRPLSVASVAYLLLVANSVHTFVDGLVIGAGFSRSISTGVGLAVACIAEEVPHQLGDFAVLVSAGMGMWRTALVKLFASAPALLGFVCGALVGQLSNAAPWIFSLAGGMFLYISLCALLPELRGHNHHQHSDDAASSPPGSRAESELGVHLSPHAAAQQHCLCDNTANSTTPQKPQVHAGTTATRAKRRTQRTSEALEYPALAVLLQHAGLFIGFGILLLLALLTPRIEALF